MIIDLVVGIGLNGLHAPNQGGPVDVPALKAELVGSWQSDVVTREQWLNRMVATGFDINDLEAFLSHDPLGVRIQYRLTFDGSKLTIASSTDDAPFLVNGTGAYSLLADGTFAYVETPPPGGLGTDCELTAPFEITGDRLVFDPVTTLGCGLDERE